MTKTSIIAAACAAALAGLAACNENGSSPAVDKAQDAASVPVGQTSAATLGAMLPGAYVSNALIGDMYEMQAADIALARSSSADIKGLAEAIKTDHAAASAALKAVVPMAAPGTEVPGALDERRQGLIDNLRSASDRDFDRVWLDQQIAAHQEAVTLYRGFAENGDVAALAGHARGVLPKIQAHLARTEALKSAL